MKLTLVAVSLWTTGAAAFSPLATFTRRTTSLNVGQDPNVYTGGNSWQPDSGKMGSTDTGDYFPEDYDQNNLPDYSEGMMGSQATRGDNSGPQLPGMENLGEDAVMMGGIEEASEIPAGMEFIPSSVPDGEFAMQVAGSSGGSVLPLSVAPVCMGFEDYYAAFSPDSHPSFSVAPVAGRMDRRGGEPTELQVLCEPKGQAGTFEGNLVINLPEDNSKICYKITANVF
mmetsp:Transcript_29094/g.35442  ORF Transcript_29094/g.35442 Transcript_29094/m.35442 type:complete len:227 (-) Transcript_29094:70-750(-)|eukprot:CAMPEP_0172482420 /NCGR_PEP_ID=MMETSP1066-20121228/8806_1 /TAXON_ID=671091 /ORGANISM="Coscinodiscus wailesii, Strain CCMP2513" /LENGTH=226 /DNA_ID=CAMNT_0013245509 /DNA_START=78 /DNA_END=758 /DNA_ORIENTATION=-